MNRATPVTTPSPAATAQPAEAAAPAKAERKALGWSESLGRNITIAKAQFLNDGIPAIPGIGSQTVLIGEKQKLRERNPSTITRTVQMVYDVDDRLLRVESRDKDGAQYTTLVPFGAIKALQVETE